MYHATAGQIPDLDPVAAGGGGEPAIRRERQTVDGAGLGLDLTNLLLRREIPDTEAAVETGGDEMLTIGGEGEATNAPGGVPR